MQVVFSLKAGQRASTTVGSKLALPRAPTSCRRGHPYLDGVEMATPHDVAGARRAYRSELPTSPVQRPGGSLEWGSTVDDRPYRGNGEAVGSLRSAEAAERVEDAADQALPEQHQST